MSLAENKLTVSWSMECRFERTVRLLVYGTASWNAGFWKRVQADQGEVQHDLCGGSIGAKKCD